MHTKKTIVFVSLLFLVFSTTACKQSGEADVAEAVAVTVAEVGAEAEDEAEDEAEIESEAVEKE